MAILRAFWKPHYNRMIRNYHRMMFGHNSVVRIKSITSSKGDKIGWVLKVTDIPLSEHDKHFLRERGLPVPGKFKCNMYVCQAKRVGIYAKSSNG